jgi:hypothetical protein
MFENARARYFQYTLIATAFASVACSSEPPKQSPSGAGGGGASASSTSGSSTGGSGGAGGAGGAGGGASVCATALFCDDFEAFAAQAEPSGAWSVSKAKGAAVVDATRAHSGKQSVKITTDASGDSYKSVMMAYGDKLPVAANVVHGRMMFWLESAPTTAVHWTFIAGQGPVPGQNHSAIYRYGGQHPITSNGSFVGNQLMANYETIGAQSDCWFHSSEKVVPVGKWACVEWKYDGPKNEMQLWLDGEELTDLHVQGVGQGCVHQSPDYGWTAPSFEKMAIGWESYQPDEPRAMWIDDVVISEGPIGCP